MFAWTFLAISILDYICVLNWFMSLFTEIILQDSSENDYVYLFILWMRNGFEICT